MCYNKHGFSRGKEIHTNLDLYFECPKRMKYKVEEFGGNNEGGIENASCINELSFRSWSTFWTPN